MMISGCTLEQLVLSLLKWKRILRYACSDETGRLCLLEVKFETAHVSFVDQLILRWFPCLICRLVNCGFVYSVAHVQIFIQTGYPLDLPSGSLGSYCIYEFHMVHMILLIILLINFNIVFAFIIFVHDQKHLISVWNICMLGMLLSCGTTLLWTVNIVLHCL